MSSRSRRSRSHKQTQRLRSERGHADLADDFSMLGSALERILVRALRAVEGLAQAPDPIDSEIAASSFLAAWAEREIAGLQDPAGILSVALVDFLEARSKGESNADALPLMLGFQAVDKARTSIDAMLAAHRLSEAGVDAPAWSHLVGKARLERAWMASDVFGDHDFLVGRFSYAGEAAHDLAVLVDHNLLDIAKDMALVRSEVNLRDEWEGQQDIVVRDVDGQEYANRLADALENLDHVWLPPVTDGVRMFRALVEARRMSLPRPKPLKRRAVSQAARGRLYKSFRRSAPAPELGADAQLARLCIDYAADYQGDALRWSPTVVEFFLTDWLPRKVSLREGEIERLPMVSRAWLRFVAEERGFENRLRGELLAAVDQFEGQFLEMIADSKNFGPAKSIAQLMEADEVDFSDPEAVQAWIDAFNARPIDEREERIGGPFVN